MSHPYRMATPGRLARRRRRQWIAYYAQLAGGVLAMAGTLTAIVLVHFI